MKAREIRELGAEELTLKARETVRELTALRLKNKSGDTAEKPVRIRLLRRDVARIQTVLRQRESK